MPHKTVEIDGATPVGTNSIVDNRDRKVGDQLLERIKPGSSLSIVTTYFILYAYEKMYLNTIEGDVGKGTMLTRSRHG